MDYNHITLFLNKFKKLIFKKEELLSLFANVITKHTHTPINVAKLSLRGSVLYVNMSPMFRNEILIHKENILKDIQELSLEYSITDIR